MRIRHEFTRTPIILLAAFCWMGGYTLPLHAQTLMKASLGNTTEPAMSLFILNMTAGRRVPSHSHEGVVFAYVLEGEIENQLDTDPPKIYRAGDFFHERPKQVHRVFRNVSKTAPAKILVFQNTATGPTGVTPLLQEPLGNLIGQEVVAIKITTAPGGIAGGHQHPGPVFGYLLKGDVESQVDPDPSKVYRAGDVFYEPPMHTHRLYRNLSKAEPAELLVFSVLKTGEPFSVRVKQ
jgi:quercetin dioxygenase-like cupin family protein